MKWDAKKYVLVALYSALFVVLSIFGTLNFQSIKITTQNLPIYLAGITCGMIPGALVGFVGMFISQILTYGFQTTTLFWVLPQTILGAVCGYIFENSLVKVNEEPKFYVTIILLQLLITILNTLVNIVDGLINGYFNYITILGSLVVRIIASVLTGIIFCIIIPPLVKLIKKIH